MKLLRRDPSRTSRACAAVAIALAANALVYAAAVVPLSETVRRASARAQVAAGASCRQEPAGAAQATVDGKRRADEELTKFYKECCRATRPRRAASRTRGWSSSPAVQPAALRGRARSPGATGERARAPGRDDDRRRRLPEHAEFIYELEKSPEFVVIESRVTQSEDRTRSSS